MTTAAPAASAGTDESELRSLSDAVRSFAADLSSEAAVRAAIASPDGYDRAVWRRAVEQLGLTSVLVPTEMQGLGFGVAELAAIAEELGAALAAARITTECIQLSGGIGFTWEHPAHLHYRRAKSNELLLGTPSEHRRAIYRLLTAGQASPTDEGAG